MTSVPALTPPAVARGVRGLRGVAGCVVEGGPILEVDKNQWVVTFSLRRDTGARFIGTTTRWCALIDSAYPFGDVAIHPATAGGLTATFPHQSRNSQSHPPRAWRGGKLCLDSPLGGKRRQTIVRDPVGDADARLQWHVERAQHWLQLAANDQLLAKGDPFELPARPPRTKLRQWARYRAVHDESAASLEAWRDREGTFGSVLLGGVSDIGNAIAAGSFASRNGDAIRGWTGRNLEKGDDLTGFWWLWPAPIVMAPWEVPATWGELRQVARAQGLDADEMLRWMLPPLRGEKAAVLFLGYPIPVRVGEPATEVHWDAVVLPPVPAPAGRPPPGFRPNARGWWHRDRYATFADRVSLQYLPTENWNPERLQARGRLPSAVRGLRVALLGVGALGSSVAEMLVRAGVRDLALVDGGVLEAGNVCRHTATLVDVGKEKVPVVAKRLRQISPVALITEVPEYLCATPEAIVAQLDEYDLIVDCTSSDEALLLLAAAWWTIPRTFASFSMGYGGRRLFSFGAAGHRFPQDEFEQSIRPWLDLEAKAWAGSEEVLEGAGCWSPLFPARHDDVVLAAATCIKELETLVSKGPSTPRLRVFSQSSSDDGFQGFALESSVAKEAEEQ